MGSVMSDIECPSCKYARAFSDYYYKQGRMVIRCEKCGFNFNGNPDDKKAIEKAKEKIYGSFKVMSASGGQIGSFSSEKDRIGFEKNFIKENGFTNAKGEKADVVTYTYKDKDGNWKIKDLINKTEIDWVKKELMESL
jgi:Zn ribbon nucleic-acid-binding protein